MRPSSVKVSRVFVLFAAGLLWTHSTLGQVVPEPTSDKWNYMVAPYLWATAIDGNVTVRGNDIEVDTSFSDLLDILDIAFAVRLEAQKGKWGYFADVFYASLEVDGQTPVGKLEVDNKIRILEAGGVYEFSPNLQGLFGLRGQSLEVDVNLGGLGNVSGDQDWVDGFVGLRFFPVRSERWLMFLRGDIGAGDSDSVLNGAVGGGYRFNKTWSLIGAYRVMSTDYEDGDFKWDIDMSGLGLALGISF